MRMGGLSPCGTGKALAGAAKVDGYSDIDGR